MAYFARETEDGRVKVSLRALEPWRVDQVAERFGGGGHRLASGLTLEVLGQALANCAHQEAKGLGDPGPQALIHHYQNPAGR